MLTKIAGWLASRSRHLGLSEKYVVEGNRRKILADWLVFCFRQLKLTENVPVVHDEISYVVQKPPYYGKEIVVGNNKVTLHVYSSDMRELPHEVIVFKSLHIFMLIFFRDKLEALTTISAAPGFDVSRINAEWEKGRSLDAIRNWLVQRDRISVQNHNALDGLINSAEAYKVGLALFGIESIPPKPTRATLIGSWADATGREKYRITNESVSRNDSDGNCVRFTYQVQDSQRLFVSLRMIHDASGAAQQNAFYLLENEDTLLLRSGSATYERLSRILH